MRNCGWAQQWGKRGLDATPAGMGPGRASRRRTQPHASTPGTAGVEGDGGTCRGAGGWWQGLDGLRGAATNEVRPPSLAGGRTRVGRSQPQASPDWRPTRGLRGLAGLRGAATNEVRPPSLAGGRTRPGHSQPQASPDWRLTRGLQAWPGFEPTRRAKLAARTASGRAGRAAAGDLSGQQAPTGGITRPRGGRPRA